MNSTMNYFASPDGSRTAQTTAMGVNPTGGGDYQDFMRQLMERNARWQEEDRNRALYFANRPTRGLGGSSGVSNRPSVTTQSHGGSLQDQQLRFEQQLAERAKLQAALQPPPMRTMNLRGGIIPGPVMDTNAMNAYQRQLFMPNQSGFEGGGLSDEQQTDVGKSGGKVASPALQGSQSEQPKNWWDSLPDAVRIGILTGQVKMQGGG